MLYGRATEEAEIRRLLADARAGTGGALVVRGEAGIGKTALLNDLAATAGDMWILRGAGYASETEQPFAFLHLLLRSVRGRVDELSRPQAHALHAVFDSGGQREEERFNLRLAVLSLLSLLTAERPVLCLVDDAQWLDAASTDTLTFTARRLESERIALVAAARDECRFTAAGLPELRLSRLDRTATTALVRARDARLSPLTREKVVAESGGNPLAALELAGSLTPAQRGGRFNPFALQDGGLVPTGPALQDFHARIGGLATSVRTLLLVAAADDTQDLGLVAVAAEALGVGPADLGHAERAGLLEVAGRALRFTHPLARPVAYHRATTTERRAAHRALAEATGDDQMELRAWQLAAATRGRCEEVAAQLEAAAERTVSRRAFAAYARAAELTPDRKSRAHRLVAAAQAASDAGLLDAAAELAAQAVSLTGDPLARVQLAQVNAEVECERGSPEVACRTLIDGACLIRERDPAKAVFMLVGAVQLGSHVGEADLSNEAADALRAVTLPAGSALAALAPAVSAVVSSKSGDPADGVRAICELVKVARASVPVKQRRPLMAALAELTAATDEGYADAADLVAEHREKGLIGRLPCALHLLGQAQVYRGRHREAWMTITEALELATEIGQLHRASRLRCLLGWLAAVKGDDDGCVKLVSEAGEYALARRIRPALSLGEWALALLDLGRGRHEAALTRLESAGSGGSRIGAARRAPDQIEAAVRCGRPDAAVRPLAVVAAWTGRSPSPISPAVAERCRALTAASEEAEERYLRAVRLHEKSDQPYERARTELTYGEWLRRARRRAEARPYLSAAADAFERLGAGPWAARARAELVATGDTTGTIRPAPHGCLDGLTPQQLQVVMLAAAGASNRDIAAQLFLSPRTVGNHLYRAFPKLGIKTRAELTELDFGTSS
ncbi:helix-turn-helix transcriptional regulator [Actinomadura sp. HBU206391]|uniref:helix-turn-helix transcriptional regulator n=1 Tax=Actinomadura sp. HBU206391 TaxID=2731692 RepID=UPI0016501F24|nr:LuxR family transcriptional regulator [Actinomadura sp. HBU206391]MBC6460704.1 AAA family ATPase [Actinomadura sp. HBU206391]